jgi:probable rRNA maturation factor
MTIIIDLNSHPEIEEEIFLQNATGIVEEVISSDIVELSPLKDYDFKNNDVSLDVMFCDNKAIHEINRDYRDKDRPTDVITFALFADSEPEMRLVCGDEIALGEIIISIERIKEQAAENNKTFKEELYFIFAHGILHLFGFTHDDDKSLEQMLGIQQRLIENVKI